MSLSPNRVQVGAAAFAVGLGIALANGAGIAAATTGDADASGASTSSATSTSDADSTASSSADETSASDESAAEENDAAEGESGESEAPADDDAADAAEEAADADEAVADEKSGNSASGNDASSNSASNDASEVVVETEESSDPDVVESAEVDHIDAATTETAVESQTVAAPIEATTEITSADPTDATATAFLSTATDADVEETWFDQLLAGLNEWFQHTFFNEHPVALPVQHMQIRGRILGTIGGSDPEGDRLVYKVLTPPKYGTIKIFADGRYEYRAFSGFAAEGGDDSFTVSVEDRGFHLHLGDLFGAGASEAVSLAAADDPSTPVPGNSVQVPVSVEPVTDVDPADNWDGPTHVWTVYNLTSNNVQFLGFQGNNPSEGMLDAPVPGTVILPGESFQFTIGRYVWSNDANVAQFLSVKEGLGIWTVSMEYEDKWSWSPTGTESELWQSACSTSGSVACSIGENYVNTDTIGLFDPTVTQITVPATDANSQSALYNALCSDSSVATCRFVPTRTARLASGNPIIIGNPVQNYGDAEISYTVTQSYTTGTTGSFTISDALKAKLGDVVEDTLTATWQTGWSESATFSQSLQVKVEKMEQGVVELVYPVFRVYGDFILSAGNTTWTLSNVYIDTPVAPGPGGAGASFRFVTSPLPPLDPDDDDDQDDLSS